VLNNSLLQWLNISISTALGILSVLFGLFASKKKQGWATGTFIVLIVVSVGLIGINTYAFFLPNPPPLYSLTPGAPWCTANFQDNPKGWSSRNKVWKIRNEGKKKYLSSIPSDDGYYEIEVPCPIPSDPQYANYAMEVEARIEDSNQGKGEFGIIIHDNGSDSGGYQGGVSFPYDPVRVFLDVSGRTDGDDHTYSHDPGRGFVTYKIQVKDTVATLFVDTTPYPSATATKFSDPRTVTIWEQGGAKVNIKTLTITAT